MTTQPFPPLRREELGSHPIFREYGYAVVVVIAFAVIMALNPIGYIGGGQDDARYVTAARCWVEHGICLPRNHWEGRWPVFAPIAAITALFGESRATVQIWPLLSSLAAALLVGEIGRRLFEGRAAIFIVAVFMSLPTFAIQLLSPSVEAIELAFVLAAILCIVNWRSTGNPIWTFLAGLSFALAFQVRETSIAAAAVTLLALYATDKRPRLSDLAWAGAGFALPLAIEFVAYQLVAGDFFFRRELSLAHTRIPSTQLDPSIDVSGSPILNPDIIGGWKREPGIHIHWLVDGPLNLVANAGAGFSLTLTPLLLLVGREHIPARDRRTAWLLLGLAAIYVAIINYFFAMDPKPRVMLTALAASSFALGLVLTRLWEANRRPLVTACLGSIFAACALLVAAYLRPAWAEQQAKEWYAEYPNAIEIDFTTRRYLTVDAELRGLPDYHADRPYAMSISEGSCDDWLNRAGLTGHLKIVGQTRLSLFPKFGSSGRSWLCLFKYEDQISAERMVEGAKQAALKAQAERR